MLGCRASASLRLPWAIHFAVAALSGAAWGADWPQLQNGPQRLGYSAEVIDVPLKRAWAVGMAPERLHPQAQPVIAQGKVFLGTAMGSFYAFEAATGKKLWTFKAGGPILHTAGVEGGKVFFACLDGNVYALDAADGKEAWRFKSGLRTGFSTAVLLAEGNVFAANRGGTYFCLSQKDGSALWKRDLAVPLLMSSAYDGGKLFFGGMDMRVYALDAKTGEVAWTSDPVAGAAFKEYWPVVCKDTVLVRPAKVSGPTLWKAIEWLRGPLPESELAKQQALLDAFAKAPGEKSLFVLDKKTGREAFTVPHWTTNTMNGATIPPCVDGDGLLIIPVTLHDWRGGWGRLDLAKRRVVEVLCEEKPDARGHRPGMGNGDENMTVSAAGRLALIFHTEEGNAQYTGVWHLDRREWFHVAPIHAEGYFVSNTQGGGGNPPAIAGGMVFHTSWNTLNARTSSPPKADGK